MIPLSLDLMDRESNTKWSLDEAAITAATNWQMNFVVTLTRKTIPGGTGNAG